MPWGIAAAAVVGAYSANQQSKAAKGAAGAQSRAADAATAEQQRQFDLTRQDQQPWMQAGQSALTQMQALNSGDFSSFKESPDYQFAFDQGLQGLDRSAAARGSLYSGGHSADLMKFGQGLASQNYNQFYNRLAGLSGTGQTTASGLGSLGQQYANNVGQIGMNNANNMASSYQQGANANSQLAGALGGAFNNWYSRNSANNGGGTGWYIGNKPGKG
jgi:hypothetical protein